MCNMWPVGLHLDQPGLYHCYTACKQHSRGQGCSNVLESHCDQLLTLTPSMSEPTTHPHT
jgi:hypothetical protein